jgi:hypothetical protein
MNIPNDTGGTWRWNKLVELYHLEDRIQDDPSPSMVLAWWADNNFLLAEQKAWLAYLYGLTYSTTTAILIFRRFPRLRCVTSRRELREFWEENKQRLYFNRDRRYIKNNDQFVDAIAGLRKFEGKKLYPNLFLLTDEQIYQRIVKNWPYFGRHAAFLFFDAYSKMLNDGECSLSSISNWNEAHTIAEGLALATYDDELYQRAKGKCLAAEDKQKLDALVAKLEEDCYANFTDLESTICAYSKLFKGTRYLGYYIDRFQEELIHARNNGYPKEDMLQLWEFRSKVSPSEFLGEYGGWSGIRKERCKLWLKEGKFL